MMKRTRLPLVLLGLSAIFAVQGVDARVGDADEKAASRGFELLEEMSEHLNTVDWKTLPDIFQERAAELESFVEKSRAVTEELSTFDVRSGGGSRQLQQQADKARKMKFASVLNANPQLKALHQGAKQNPKTRLFVKTHEALMNGDVRFISEHIASLAKRTKTLTEGVSHGNRERRLTFQSQCEALVEAAKQYSLFGLFVALYKDNIDEDDGTFDPDAQIIENVFDKMEAIAGTLKAIKESAIDRTKCNSLLEQFHTNVEMSAYNAYIPDSVNTVQRGVNPATYVQLEGIKKAKDTSFFRQAEMLFEDFVSCTEYLQTALAPSEPSLFVTVGSDRRARIPLRVSSPDGKTGVTGHGAPNTNLDSSQFQNFFFKYGTPDIFTELFDSSKKEVYKPRKGNDDENQLYDTNNIYDDLPQDPLMQTCNLRVVEYLTDLFYSLTVDKPSDLRLDSYEARRIGYGGLWIRCKNEECEGSTNIPDCYYQCTVRSVTPDDDESKIDDDCENMKIKRDTCPFHEGNGSCGDSKTLFFKHVPSPWTAGGDYEVMTTLAFGDDPHDSGSLVCRLAEKAESMVSPIESAIMPGYCCMDRPFDASGGDDLWGYPYVCGDECMYKAPLFASFSEGACRIYSGTFCSYPRDCTDLLTCVDGLKGEVNPENGNADANLALFDFLNTAPEVLSASSSYECGQLREYFGFDSDYPIDEDICADIDLLKDSDEYGFINRYNSGTQEDKPNPDAVLFTPEIPSFTSNEGFKWREANFALSQVTLTLRELHDYISNLECPCTPAVADGLLCTIAKNAIMTPALAVLVASEVAHDVSEFSYEEKVGLSDYQMNEIYFNVMILWKNMDLTLKEIEKTQLTVNQIKPIVTETNTTAHENQEYLIDINRIVIETQEALAITDATVNIINATVTYNKNILQLINDTVNEILEIVTPPQFIDGVKNYGCDGIDQDDDGTADECDEDSFPPQLILPQCLGFTQGTERNTHLLSDKIFASAIEARAFLEEAVGVTDDCAPEQNLELLVSAAGTETCSETFTLTPHHVNRSPCMPMGGESHVFVMQIEPTAPLVTCGFSSGLEQGYLFLREGNEKAFANTEFSFAVTADCSDTMSVKVTVTSNEKDFNLMVLLDPKSSLPEQAELFVSTHPCGNDSSRFCVGEDGVPRVYAVTVEVTDTVGHTSVPCTQKLIIVPSSYGQGNKMPTEDHRLELIALVENKPTPFAVGALDLTRFVAGFAVSSG